MGLGSMHPDVIFAIDFGMTCTGVAFSTGPDWTEPRTIQRWPAKLTSATYNKVPTLVAYEPESDQIVHWGAQVDLNDEKLEVSRLFKVFLEPKYQPDREAEGLPDVDDARQWFQDYLSCIYQHILEFISKTFPRSNQKTFEFLFSTPTTWRDPAMINDIKRLIHAAGFGQEPNHEVVMSATEAEAAAIYASKSGYKKDDVILVCDAGGGTTDVHVFKAIDVGHSTTRLSPLTFVEGEHVGSTLIDFKVKKLVIRKLEMIRQFLTQDPQVVGDRMMKEGSFEGYKCSFDPRTVVNLVLPIKEVPEDFYHPHANVEDSKLIITREEMQAIFDEQVDRMFNLVDSQLRIVLQNYGNEKVNFLILSGGFGSSEYVQQRFKTRYEMNAGGGVANAHDLSLMVASDPQLAVVHGLILGRTQELRGKSAVFTEIRARNSYGILCRQVYNPKSHLREDVVQDPRDKLIYAEGQIDWLIKQGQRIDAEKGVEKVFRVKVDMGKERLPWQVHIMMSPLPSDQLPKSIRHDGVRKVCTVKARLETPEMKRQNHRWFDRKDEYSLGEFTVKVLVGFADLQFAMFTKDKGRRVDFGHDRVAVEWLPPTSGKQSSGPEDLTRLPSR